MQEIINTISKNKNLVYINAEDKKETGFSNLLLDDSLIHKAKRSLVFLYIDNSISSISIFFSMLQSVHVLALLSPRVNPAFKNNLEQLYQPFLVYDPLRQDIPGYVRQRVSEDFFLFKNNSTPDILIHPALKLMLSTSGTTGSPKFVKLSEYNLLSNALSIIDYLPISQYDTAPLNLPVYYSYGLSILTTNAIFGGKIVCTNKDVLNKDFWSDFTSFGFTSLAGVPYVYEMLYRIGFTQKKHPSLRYMTQAGGKLTTNLVKAFAEYAQNQSIQFYVMYGQTEATARMSFLEPRFLETKLGSIGKAIKNGTFYIDEQTGELLYQGPNVFGGYAEELSDLKEFDEGEILHTGDIATVDDDGFYYITGRAKRFVKIVGSRINLDEVETMLKNHFQGNIFYVTGIQDRYILVVTTDNVLNTDKAADYLNKELGIHRSFIRIRQIKQIPLTENGKVNYTKIQQDEVEGIIR